MSETAFDLKHLPEHWTAQRRNVAVSVLAGSCHPSICHLVFSFFVLLQDVTVMRLGAHWFSMSHRGSDGAA